MGDDLSCFQNMKKFKAEGLPWKVVASLLQKGFTLWDAFLVFCQPGGLFWSNLTQLHHSVTFKDCNFVHQQLM